MNYAPLTVTPAVCRFTRILSLTRFSRAPSATRSANASQKCRSSAGHTSSSLGANLCGLRKCALSKQLDPLADVDATALDVQLSTSSIRHGTREGQPRPKRREIEPTIPSRSEEMRCLEFRIDVRLPLMCACCYNIACALPEWAGARRRTSCGSTPCTWAKAAFRFQASNAQAPVRRVSRLSA